MPTGYTAAVVDGTITEFRDYAYQCARAFGACIMLRDKDISPDLPDTVREVSDHHTKALEQAQANLDRLLAMDQAALERLCDEQHAEAITNFRRSVAKAEQENARIDAMIAKVEAWTPPRPDYDKYKGFMLEQLRMSRHEMKYYTPPAGQTPDELVSYARRAVEYHKKELSEDQERARGANEWVRVLKASIM